MSLIKTQILPIYDISDAFYVDGGQGSLTTNISNFPVTFPTGFIISTASHRKPFLAISQVDHFTFDSGKYIYFFTELTTFTATSFNLKI